MRKFVLFLSTALFFAPAGAFAADLDELRPGYDWTGIYAGLNAGYAFGGDDAVGVEITGLGSGNVGDLSNEGWTGGVQAGYNYQVDSFVFGVEADIQGGEISDDGSYTEPGIGDFEYSSKIDYYGTLRARAGFAYDNMLFYGTGGLAYGDLDYEVSYSGDYDANISDSGTKFGYAVGGGMEYGFPDNWSVRIEYMYVNLGSDDLNAPVMDGGVDTGETASTKSTPGFHTVRIGANWKF